MRHYQKWHSFEQKLLAWLEISNFSYELLKNHLKQNYGRKANAMLERIFERRRKQHMEDIKKILFAISKIK